MSPKKRSSTSRAKAKPVTEMRLRTGTLEQEVLEQVRKTFKGLKAGEARVVVKRPARGKKALKASAPTDSGMLVVFAVAVPTKPPND